MHNWITQNWTNGIICSFILNFQKLGHTFRQIDIHVTENCMYIIKSTISIRIFVRDHFQSRPINTNLFPCRIAVIRGLCPLLLIWVTLAPLSISNLATFSCPYLAARWRGVVLFLSIAFMSALDSNNNLAHFSCPKAAAQSNGVQR